VGEKDVHLECLPFDHLGAGTVPAGGQSAGDCVDSVQRTREDEVFVRG
jgi:hypothetical protein